MQIVFGALRLGRFVNWLPFAVVRGVFVGVGGYIFMTQTLWFLGAPVEPGIGVVAIIASWPQAVANINVDAFAVATISLAGVHAVAGPAAPGGAQRAGGADRQRRSPERTAGSTRRPGSASRAIGFPGSCRTPVLTTAVLVDAIQPALILAFLSSIYNLLTALVIDPIAGRTHKPNRELIGLGVGNVAAGLIGALPGAQRRPRARCWPPGRAGGRRSPAWYAPRCCLAVLFGLGNTLAWIPDAAFAGILIKVAWDMMDVRFLRRIPKLSPDIGLVTLLTAALSTFVDVISAIAVGFFISGMAYAMRSQRQEINQTISTPLLDMVLFRRG